jgi:GNAT superfamily N-acetyltransferase
MTIAPAWQGREVASPVEIRELARSELSRVGEIDRTERIDLLFEQRGTELIARAGNWSAPPWDPDGDGEHSVASHHRALVHYVDAGGIARGAFAGERVVGIGVVVPHIRPAIAQLAFLHVSRDFRAAGVGSRLSAQLELIARGAGDTEIVVSATPSENTVRFYLARGFRPTARPLPELLALEPEDIHMAKKL